MRPSFISYSTDSPKRVFRIWADLPVKSNDNPLLVSGWNFYVAEIDQFGKENPIYDGWDEDIRIIIQYPSFYTTEELVWHNEQGDYVDLMSMRFV